MHNPDQLQVILVHGYIIAYDHLNIFQVYHGLSKPPSLSSKKLHERLPVATHGTSGDPDLLLTDNLCTFKSDHSLII